MMWFLLLESISSVQSLTTKLCSAVIFLYAESIDVQQRTGQLSEQAGEKRCTIISCKRICECGKILGPAHPTLCCAGMMWFLLLESISSVQSLTTKLCSAVIFLYAESIDVQQRTGQLSEQAGEKRYIYQQITTKDTCCHTKSLWFAVLAYRSHTVRRSPRVTWISIDVQG